MSQHFHHRQVPLRWERSSSPLVMCGGQDRLSWGEKYIYEKRVAKGELKSKYNCKLVLNFQGSYFKIQNMPQPATSRKRNMNLYSSLYYSDYNVCFLGIVVVQFQCFVSITSISVTDCGYISKTAGTYKCYKFLAIQPSLSMWC